MPKLSPPSEGATSAFVRVMEGLGDRLGPLLLQFRYFRKAEMPDPAYWDIVFAAMQNVIHSPRGTAKLIVPAFKVVPPV